MAFQLRIFRTRALTAIVFVGIMLAGLFWNPWSFFFLFTIIHFGCWWEFLRLIEKIYHTPFHSFVKIGLMTAGYGLMIWFSGSGFVIEGYGIRENFSLPVSGAGFALTIAGIFRQKTMIANAFFSACTGLVYISLSFGLMLHLYSIGVNRGMVISGMVGIPSACIFPILIISTIWINDTMAYIVGSLIGKTPLSVISPKKTWEGTLGGIILSVGVIALLIGFVVEDSASHFRYHGIAIPAIGAIAGTFGDLFESKLKRSAEVKDSGRIMPGHGGFLDRFDSLLFATPFVWLYIQLFL